MQEKHGRIAELLLHPVCRLLIPLFVLSGFQQGFLYADYSKVIPTMHWAGVIADYGNHNCAAHSSDKSVHNNAPGLTSGTDRFCCLSQSLRHTVQQQVKIQQVKRSPIRAALRYSALQ